MIELAKHIEILLLKHNCVIVPHLGGFIAQDMPARYVAEENIFLPPHRTVGFNPQLTLNDGLLVQSYMQAYGTNYTETVKMIDQSVANLKEELQQKGEFEFNGIGTITLGVDGLYYFKPNEAGIISPNLYGLDAVPVKVVSEKERKETMVEKKAAQTKVGHNPKTYTFSINRELVNYVAAAAITIFFYFLWATPATQNHSLSKTQASILFPHSIEQIKSEATEFMEVEKDSCEATVAAQTASDDVLNEPAPVVENSNHFTIVLVSCVPMKNAKAYVEKLKEKGLTNVSILEKNHIVRVVYNSYPSEKEAYSDLNHLRKNYNEFNEAWIYEN